MTPTPRPYAGYTLLTKMKKLLQNTRGNTKITYLAGEI